MLSTRTVREVTDTVSQESAAWRTRALSQAPVASLFLDTVDEPVRRWGQKPGVRWGWALGEEGRQGLRSLSPTKRER